MNMLATIIPKSDQINADDLIGKTMTITVTDVKFSGGQEQPVSMYFDGSDKAFRPCKSMCRVLVATWGPDANAYVGKSMTLYRDPSVKFGGLEVGGIRISHMSDIDEPKTMALTATRANRKPFTVRPLVSTGKADKQPAENGLADAKAAIAAAADLDALRRVWTSKAMAPFREQLQDALDQRKSELSFDQPATGATDAEAEPPNTAEEVAASASEGPADDQRGEKVTPESARAEIDSAETVIDVNNRLAALRQHLSDDEGDDLVAYAGARIDVLKAG